MSTEKENPERPYGYYWARLGGLSGSPDGAWEILELNSCGWFACGSEIAVEWDDLQELGSRIICPYEPVDESEWQYFQSLR